MWKQGTRKTRQKSRTQPQTNYRWVFFKIVPVSQGEMENHLRHDSGSGKAAPNSILQSKLITPASVRMDCAFARVNIHDSNWPQTDGWTDNRTDSKTNNITENRHNRPGKPTIQRPINHIPEAVTNQDGRRNATNNGGRRTRRGPLLQHACSQDRTLPKNKKLNFKNNANKTTIIET